MRARRAFRIGGWVALMAGVLAAIAAATVAVVGILALSGRVSYPVDVGVGPFSVRATVSMPVTLSADVCQKADIDKQNTARDCFRFFVHQEDGRWANGRIRRQDADVRPTSATLKGSAELATTGGWSPLVAASVAGSVINLAVLSGLLLLVWRALATAAAGEAFSSRTVRHLRGIGWLVIVSAVAGPALAHFTSAGQFGYSAEAFGIAPQLEPLGSAGYPGGVEVGQLALGALILLVAEIFRHGAAIEAERRLTV